MTTELNKRPPAIKRLYPGKTALHALLLVAAIFVAYSKVFHAGFMSWDDLDYVFNTRDIDSGISGVQVKHWFSRNYLGNYQPLVVFTYALDHAIGGANPVVYHLHSLLWHVAATLLVYSFINKLQNDKWVAFFVALLFAIHPVQTESVSWIAARNKSMNAVFYFSAMCFYVSYVNTRKKSMLVLVTLCGLLAYICKATALALPLALIAVDIWLRRPLNTRKIWLEKLPLVLAGIPVALITLSAQKDVNFLQHHGSFGLNNIIFAGYAFVEYATHLIFPVQLSVLYPYPGEVTFVHLLFLFLALAVVTIMIIAYRRGWHAWAGGILFFTVNLLPVLQLVQFGETLMADRYLYIACVGLWFPLVYQFFRLFRNKSPLAGIAVSTVVCIVLLVMTFSRNSIWLNEISFWGSVLDKFPESTVAHYSMGTAYMKEGDLESAGRHMNLAVQSDPNNFKAWRNKGALLLRQGKTKEALSALNKSLDLHPYPGAYFTRAMLYHGMHSYALAMRDVNKVLMQEPVNARAYCLRADCEEQLGNPGQALKDYSRAVACDDREPLFLVRRGLLQAKSGEKKAALSDLDRAIALKPGNGESLYYRALIRHSLGQSPCADLQQALQNGYKPAGEMLAEVCR